MKTGTATFCKHRHHKSRFVLLSYLLVVCLLFTSSMTFAVALEDSEEADESDSKDNPFEFRVSLMGDFATNISGGIRRSGTYMGIVDLFATFNTQKAGLWKGGQFFLHGLNTHGGLATERLIGDIQVCSNIEAGDYTGLFEYYFKQKIGQFSVLIGQHDLNSEFVVVENGANFINSSFGVPASISLNFPAPIFPMASMAVLASWSPGPNFKLLAGLYDGDPGCFQTNEYGINNKIDLQKEGFLSIGEIQYHIIDAEGKVSGSYKIGGYYHSAVCLDLTKNYCEITGKNGFYLLMDQNLMTIGPDKIDGLKMFSQIGWGPSPSNLVDFYLGGGFTYTSIFTKKGKDQIGLGVAHSSINNNILAEYNQFNIKAETALEITYTYQITENLGIQPDLQYIVKTEKMEEDSNALVGIVRIKFDY